MNQLHKQKCYSCSLQERCIFKLLTVEQKQLLDSKKVFTKKKAGAVIAYERYHANTFFVIAKGIAKVVKQVNEDKELVISLKTVGDFAGLEAIEPNGIYKTSTICITETEFCNVPGNLIVQLLKGNEAVFNFICHQFSLATSGILERTMDLAGSSAQRRLSNALLLLYDNSGRENNSIQIKREELVGIVGVSRETVSRLLSAMKKKGLISFKDHSIKLLKPVKLRQLATA